MADSPLIPYTAREFETAYEALKSFVLATNPTLYSDFTQSNAGVMILRLLAASIDILSAGQDFAAAESYLSTCRTYEAGIRFAKSVGYLPRTASAATVSVVCNPLPASITSGGGTVPAGQIVTIGGVPYKLLTAVTIPASSTVYAFTLTQVEEFTETFAPISRAFQRIATSNFIVAQGSWHVFVGDASNPANEWTAVEELLLLATASNSYQVSFDAAGRLSVLFGNGASGAVPTDTITIRYTTTKGEAGNLPVFGVTGSLTATISGGTASLSVTNTEGAATGGRDRESLDDLKRNIPAYIRTNSRVITMSDYESFLSQQDGVALVWTDISLASYEGNTVKSNVWGSENVTFTSESQRTTLRSSVPYSRYTRLPPDKAATLHLALKEKTMVTVHNRILRPVLAYADIYAGDIKYDRRYDKATLHDAVTSAVVGVFENGSGFLVRMSEIVNAIRDVPGIRQFNIPRVVFDFSRAGYATGSIIFSGNPTDGDTVSINDGVRGYAFEFDSNASTVSGRVRVVIGANAEATATNLVNAINQNLAVRAYRDPVLGGPTVSLVHSREGSAYNLPIVENSSVITVVGFMNGTYERVALREDRRLDQSPIPDPYPIGTYTVGVENGTGSGWLTGGVAPYYALKDLDIKAIKSARNFYDEVYLFNNEIRYDAGIELTPDIQAINLRRLVFDLLPDVRINIG